MQRLHAVQQTWYTEEGAPLNEWWIIAVNTVTPTWLKRNTHRLTGDSKATADQGEDDQEADGEVVQDTGQQDLSFVHRHTHRAATIPCGGRISVKRPCDILWLVLAATWGLEGSQCVLASGRSQVHSRGLPVTWGMMCALLPDVTG